MTRLPPFAALGTAAVTAIGATALAFSAGASRASEGLAAAGATATLVVEYQYQSAGRREKKDELDEWDVQRSATVRAELVARKPAPMPTLQRPDAAQTARMEKQGAQVNAAAAQMAPMMAGAEAILAKCKQDQQCIERETMKMGAAMSGSPQVDAARRTGRETAAAVQPGAASYQLWQSTGQSGRWQVSERHHREAADPICMGQPKMRCVRDVSRGGQGEWPRSAGGPALVEVDLQANRLALMLPVPLDALGVTETVTTTDPSRKSEAGMRPGKVLLRTTSDGKAGSSTPLVVPLKGGWRSQSGEQIVQVGGALGEGGTLNIRWRFDAP